MSLRTKHPKIADRIETLWGTRLCEPYLVELIDMHSQDVLLHNELAGLLNLHRNLD